MNEEAHRLIEENKSLRKEIEGLKKILKAAIEATNILAETGIRTVCADCGKPAGVIHNCKEQAAANRKARR